MTTINRGLNYDSGYGVTPEHALLDVLHRQPAFDSYDAEYLGDKPEFMDIKVQDIPRHDWRMYDSPPTFPKGKQSDGPFVRIKRPYDMGNVKDKVRISISNVWVEVNWNDDERADVKFNFAIELDERQWTGEYRITGELDKTWKCRRISTEPK